MRSPVLLSSVQAERKHAASHIPARVREGGGVGQTEEVWKDEKKKGGEGRCVASKESAKLFLKAHGFGKLAEEVLGPLDEISLRLQGLAMNCLERSSIHIL